MNDRAATLRWPAWRAVSAGLFAVASMLAGCGDDEIDGQGGGAGATTSDAASSGSSGSGSTGSTSGTPSASSGGSESVGTGGGAGSGGDGAGGDGSGGDGAGGGGETGGGGGGPACPEQPDPYEIGDDTSDACGDLEDDPNAPQFHVEFIGEPTETYEYDGTIALDYAFSYVLALRLAGLQDFTLTESRCQLLAGDEEPTCSEGDIDISELEEACSERLSGRFGIDPSGVHEGINAFDFTMTLRAGCAVVSDTFTYVVDYRPEEG